MIQVIRHVGVATLHVAHQIRMDRQQVQPLGLRVEAARKVVGWPLRSSWACIALPIIAAKLEHLPRLHKSLAVNLLTKRVAIQGEPRLGSRVIRSVALEIIVRKLFDVAVRSLSRIRIDFLINNSLIRRPNAGFGKTGAVL